jgi:hypothetical protein
LPATKIRGFFSAKEMGNTVPVVSELPAESPVVEPEPPPTPVLAPANLPPTQRQLLRRVLLRSMVLPGAAIR